MSLKTALVLGGGAARGAYEAGVIAYLREELEPELGRKLQLDILTGTSVGAIHACHLAATAHEPAMQGRALIDQWRSLHVAKMLDFGVGDVLRLAREAFGLPQRDKVRRIGGLINPKGLKSMVLDGIEWPAIGRNIRSGFVEAVSLNTTHVGTGKTVVFVQRRDSTLPPWGRDPNYLATPTRIGPKHALASAAVPVLFPPVRVAGKMYVDGGLRMNVPLSPALRLGAERVAVISLRHDGRPTPTTLGDNPTLEDEEEQSFATAPFLFGKTLNAFLLDRCDQDLDRLRRINSILDAGTRTFGRSFDRMLNDALVPHRNQPVRYVRNLLIRPSQDIGALAAEYARSADFQRGARGIAGRVIRRLAEREAPHEADLVSYLLFDGGFADILIELGRNDGRAQAAEWHRFFSEEPQSEVEEALAANGWGASKNS